MLVVKLEGLTVTVPERIQAAARGSRVNRAFLVGV
jgi:hypothetical protein